MSRGKRTLAPEPALADPAALAAEQRHAIERLFALVDAQRRSGQLKEPAEADRPFDGPPYPTLEDVRRPFDPGGLEGEDAAEAWRHYMAAKLEALAGALHCGPAHACRNATCRRGRRCLRRKLLGMAEPEGASA